MKRYERKRNRKVKRCDGIGLIRMGMNRADRVKRRLE